MDFPIPRFDKHPFVWAFLWFLLILASLVEPLWSLFTEKPLVPTVTGWLGMTSIATELTQWLYLLPVLLGLGMLFLIWLRIKNRPVEFYNTRSEAPSLKDLFGNCKKIALLFQTGTVIKETDFLTWAKVVNAVLMHPQGEYVANHIRLHGSEQSFVSEIRNMTAKLTKPGTSVWWYDGPISNSMILGDPESEADGIIQVKVSYPYSNNDQRPVFIVRAKDNPTLFENLKNQYYRIANKSEPPDLKQDQIKKPAAPFKLEPFKRTELRNQNVTVVGLCITNLTGTRLEHCSVRIEEIEPSDPDSIEWIFSDSKIARAVPTEESFALNPEDKKNVPIAQLDAINAGLANLGIELLCFSTQKYPALDLEQSYILTIRVSSEIGQPIERKYKLWVDGLKQLCFQAAD